ncbi:flagellar filament capping protein FliD [Peptococcaceae bacterium]|nr:flagellar filament capping protein FliD [Peptococcaceae bacterium]
MLRVGGLATGMDIEQIINDLMKIERMRVERLEQQKQILEWKQEDYREINNSLRALEDNVFKMKMQSTYLAKTAVSSNENVLTATAGANAMSGTYEVTVHSLASGVHIGSQRELAEERKGDGTIKTLSEQFGISGTVSFTLKAKNREQTFSFDTAGKTIYDVVTEINNADLGVRALYDSSLNRFFLTTEDMGSDAIINVVKDDSSFLSDLNGDGTNTLKLKLQTGTAVTGTDAKIDFGDVKGLKFNSNNFTINGISMTVKATGSSKITVSNDIDGVMESIKSFVELYNSTIDKINKELTEKRHRNYLPLTDEQREQLSDEQERKWEELARSGLLRGDDLLSGVVYKMRREISSKVAGASNPAYNTLAEIGISTRSYHEHGKLYIDEEKLRAALKDDIDAVMELFTKNSYIDSEKGIARRLEETLETYIDAITNKAGTDYTLMGFDNSTLGKEILRVNRKIKEWEERLKAIEDRYWAQFAAMERAINQMNQQSLWLAQQFNMV